MAEDADTADGQLSPAEPSGPAEHEHGTGRGAGESTSDNLSGPGAEDDDAQEREDPQADGGDEADVAFKEYRSPKRALSPVRMGLAFGLAVVVALSGLVGWLAYRANQSYQADQQHKLFLQAGKQEALNLTTISYTEVDADIQRILDLATGTFYDDFQKRSPAFVEVVKQAQSKTSGSITEAALESVTGDSARVLLAVSVKTSNIGAADQQPRNWRMRIDVQKVGDAVKASNVGFVP